MFRNFKIFWITLLVLIASGFAFAFAATNTVPDSAAGYKANVVPGCTVTNLVDDLDATDPTMWTPSPSTSRPAVVQQQPSPSRSRPPQGKLDRLHAD